MTNLISILFKTSQRWRTPAWVSLLVAAGVFVNPLSAPLQASEVPTDPLTAEPLAAEPLTLDDINNATSLTPASPPEESTELDIVTNVSQLRDVQPTDWAYQALDNLVSRYGCIAGYPDGTFRGNRALTRYEFAAGLNACLQQIERLLSTSGDFATKQDLATLQKLVDDFGVELATLRTRVDGLEGRVSFLENHQFSTTTKLSGLAVFNLTGASAGGDLKVETSSNLATTPYALRSAGRDAAGNPIQQTITDNPNITMSNLVWLTLQSSFTGKDSLVTQLAAGNGNSPANSFTSAGLYNTFGTPFLDQTAGTEANNVILRELFYSFPVGDQVQVVVGPRINWYRYFDGNAFNFFLTGTSTFNSNGSTLLNTIDRGAGAVVLWNVTPKVRFRAGYLGESNEFLPAAFFNTASEPSKGLFGPTNTISAELGFSPTATSNIRVTYSRSLSATNAFVNGVPACGVGGATGEPIYGVADDGQGGCIHPARGNTIAVNFDWLLSSRFGLFGRYSYGSTNITPRAVTVAGGSIKAQSYQFGLALPDLGKPGALGTLSFLVPFDVNGGRNFLAAGGGNGGTQYEIEAAYFYPISSNVAIVPAFYMIGNPNNFSDNPNIYVGNLRTQFSF